MAIYKKKEAIKLSWCDKEQCSSVMCTSNPIEPGFDVSPSFQAKVLTDALLIGIAQFLLVGNHEADVLTKLR